MKVIVIIQARMGSSRLPGKVLKPLGSSVVLDYVVTRCREVSHVEDVIVATSTLRQDDAIQVWCKKSGVTCFRGSEDDVLSRYYECVKPYSPDYVIRVTADCPFVDYELADDIISSMMEDPADIAIVKGDLPRGLVVEMISFEALEFIQENGHEPRHREHVTYYAYEYPNEFKATYVQVQSTKQQPQLRITLDTEEDYQLCQRVAEAFAGDNLVSSQAVIDYLINHPEVAMLNAHIEQKPVI